MRGEGYIIINALLSAKSIELKREKINNIFPWMKKKSFGQTWFCFSGEKQHSVHILTENVIKWICILQGHTL